MFGLLGGSVLAFSGVVIGWALERLLWTGLGRPGSTVGQWFFAVPVFAVPLLLSIGLGYLITKGGSKAGKPLAYCGAILSIVLPVFLATLA
jgi:hypothetical protein